MFKIVPSKINPKIVGLFVGFDIKEGNIITSLFPHKVNKILHKQCEYYLQVSGTIAYHSLMINMVT